MEQKASRFSLKQFLSFKSIPEALKYFFPSYICFLSAGVFAIMFIHNADVLSDAAGYILCGIALALIGCMASNIPAARGLVSQKTNLFLSLASGLAGALYAFILFLLQKRTPWMSSSLILCTGVVIAAGVLFEVFIVSLLQKGSSMRHLFSVLLHAILLELIMNILSGGLVILYMAVQMLLFPDSYMEGFADGPILLFTAVYPLLLFPVLARREEQDFPKFLYYFFSCGVMPLLAAFTGVFYIYLLRILVLGEWPSNEVAPLVLFGSAVGIILTVFFLHQREKKAARLFLRIFPAAWLLPLGMFFTSVLIRVRAYGCTPERMLLVLFGFWMLFLLAASFFSKKLSGSTVILSFLLTFVLAVMPPVSFPFRISRQDQAMRLNRALQDAQMGTWHDVLPREDTGGEIAQRILSSADYLTENTGARIVSHDGTVYDGQNAEQVFGFTHAVSEQNPYENPSFHTVYSVIYSEDGSFIDTAGSRYYISDLAFWPGTDFSCQGGKLKVTGAGLLKIDLDGSLYTFDLNPVMQEAAQRYEAGDPVWYIADVSRDGQTLRLLIRYLEYEDTENGSDLSYMSFDLLVME